MSVSHVPWRVGLVGLLVVGLPLLGYWARQHQEPGCALDGAPINPRYRVTVVDGQGRSHEFCCLRCAHLWLARQPAAGPGPAAITVTDETTGQPLDAAEAWYVRSLVVTNPATGNRIHVFGSRAAAESHAANSFGTVLTGEETPFQNGRRVTP
jgi:hypothetical protein